MVGITPRVAIVGTGMMGEIHKRSSLLAGGVLVGVLGSSPQKSKDYAKLWNAEKSFDSIEELAVSDSIDTVHICSPNGLHFDQVKILLGAGKNVVCEKPLVTSFEQASTLKNLVANTNGKITIPFVYRFHPMIRHLKTMLTSGQLGKINLVHGSYLQDWLLSSDATNWRVDSTLGGPSRAFADIGSHWCDLLEWLLGEQITELVAVSNLTNKERPEFASGKKQTVSNEDAMSLLAKTNSGVTISAVFSQVSAGRKNRLWFEIDGSEQSAVFDQELPESIEVGNNLGFGSIVRNPETNSQEANRYSLLPGGHPQGYLECFESFVKDSYEYFVGSTVAGLPTFEDGFRSTKLVDAVLRSDSNKSWVEV